MTIYSKEYLDAYDVLEESWDTEQYTNAKQLRDCRARELRRQGWTVQIETVDTGYLAIYSLFAEKKKNGGNK